MKKQVIILAAILFSLSLVSSCGQEETPEKSHLLNSFELNVQGDTINKMYNGMKQGIWVEKINGRTQTVGYRNDTLITM